MLGMRQMSCWEEGTSLTRVVIMDSPSGRDVRAYESVDGCRDAVGSSRARVWPRLSSSPSPSGSVVVAWESGGLMVEPRRLSLFPLLAREKQRSA